MTMPRLAILICIGLWGIDYKFNDGRLANDLWDTMVQWGYWVDDNLSSLARRVVPG
jgi:hypothetical protein